MKRKRATYNFEPQNVTEDTWFYENGRGLDIVHNVKALNLTCQIHIPWKMIAPAFRRDQAVKRQRKRARGRTNWRGKKP